MNQTWYHRPAISVTLETEEGRSQVQGLPGYKVSSRLAYLKIKSGKGLGHSLVVQYLPSVKPWVRSPLPPPLPPPKEL